MEIDKAMLDAINSQPVLLSALYDMNLLPEQIETKEQLSAMTYFASGFTLGIALNEGRGK
jgi:hypothetical protein